MLAGCVYTGFVGRAVHGAQVRFEFIPLALSGMAPYGLVPRLCPG